MKVTFNIQSQTRHNRLALTELDRDEASTLYFALVEYKKNLDASLNKVQDIEDEVARHEEQMFLHDTLAKVTRLLYEMMYPTTEVGLDKYEAHPNTQQDYRNAYRRWIDVL